MFQSSPALMDGRNRWIEAFCRSENAVSILARPHGRAQPPLAFFMRDRGFWFQSSPALMDGRNAS